MRLVALALVVVAIALWTFLLSSRGKPSVLLITVDAQRPDRLGCYGHPKNHTPGVDRLAREGTLFRHAYCDIPWTTGSMASVMTGTYSNVHGLQLPTQRLRPGAATLAEILAAHGYRTAAVIGSFPLDAIYDLDRGFAVYDENFSLPMIEVPGKPIEHVRLTLEGTLEQQRDAANAKLTNDAYRSDEAVTDAAIALLDRDLRSHLPFFLWVHYFGPHEKLTATKSIVEQEPEIVAAYDADVEAADRAVARLLDDLRADGLIESTMVVYHADHGQCLGEHDRVGHGTMIFDAVTRIPLIIRYPRRFRAGVERDGLARNVDILPTVLSTLGIDAHAGGEGRPLDRDFRNRRDEHGALPAAYTETYVPTLFQRVTVVPGVGNILGPVTRISLRTPEWILSVSRIVGPCTWGGAISRDMLGDYALANAVPLDEARCRSFERVDLFADDDAGDLGDEVSAQHPDVVAALRARLDGIKTAPRAANTLTLSPEAEGKLRSLGYLR